MDISAAFSDWRLARNGCLVLWSIDAAGNDHALGRQRCIAASLRPRGPELLASPALGRKTADLDEKPVLVNKNRQMAPHQGVASSYRRSRLCETVCPLMRFFRHSRASRDPGISVACPGSPLSRGRRHGMVDGVSSQPGRPVSTAAMGPGLRRDDERGRKRPCNQAIIALRRGGSKCLSSATR
jgi:hypothetical protein